MSSFVAQMNLLRRHSRMGEKAKKSLKTKIKKVSAAFQVSQKKDVVAAAADFLPLEGGRGKKIEEEKLSTLVGFRTVSMKEKWKTRKSKHYGFLEFEDPEVAEVVADCMHNYLLFEHLLQVHLIPPEKVHPKLWRGFFRYQPVDWVQIQRKLLNKERTLEEHKKLVGKIMKQINKRQRSMAAARLDYACLEIVGDMLQAPKKIKFSE